MSYKVRATRRADGSYDLSYGKGSRKLTAVAVKEGKYFVADNRWRGMLRELKEAWGEWAARQYGTVTQIQEAQEPAENFEIDNPAPAGEIASISDITGADGVVRRITYSTEGSVISKVVVSR